MAVLQLPLMSVQFRVRDLVSLGIRSMGMGGGGCWAVFSWGKSKLRGCCGVVGGSPVLIVGWIKRPTSELRFQHIYRQY